MLAGVVELLDSARRTAGRSINVLMTATYWEIGRRIVEHEQGGETWAAYGQAMLSRLAADLTSRFGRGFGASQLRWMRQFFVAYPDPEIRQSLIGGFAPTGPAPEAAGKGQSAIGASPPLTQLARAFPRSWTHYVRLLIVHTFCARQPYEPTILPDETLLDGHR